MDARPSDVFALAVRTGCPIYVAEEVMARAAKDIQELEGPAPTGEGMEEIIKEMEAIMQALPPKQEEDNARP